MTDSDAVRTLIGDTAKVIFTDDQIAEFLTLVPGNSIFYAAALACDAQAAAIGASLKEVSIGDFRDVSGRNQVTALAAQATKFRAWEEETPAFDVAQEGLSEFNYLTILRNYILKTEGP